MEEHLKFVMLVMVLLTASACSEDPELANLKSAVRVDNSLMSPVDRLELQLATDLKLQKRVFEIQNHISQAIVSDMEFEKLLGRSILKNRFVDPNTAFSEGADDPRLALVPVMTDFLDSINQEMNKSGLYIDSVAWMSKEDYLASKSVQTGNGNSITLSQNISFASKFFDCFDQGTVFTVFTGILAGVGAAKISGAMVVGSINGIGAIGLVGAGYYSFRVGECHGDLWRSKNYGVEDNSMRGKCLEHIKNNPRFVDDFDGYNNLKGKKTEAYYCIMNHRRQMAVAVANFKEKYGDTLMVIVNQNN